MLCGYHGQVKRIHLEGNFHFWLGPWADHGRDKFLVTLTPAGA